MGDFVVSGRWTTYKGVKMRSRLEASFAAHLDSLDVTWAYEPRCYADETGQYLPDFQVTKDDLPPLFYEVKPPTADHGKALSRMHIIRASLPLASLLVVIPYGTPPYTRWQTTATCFAPLNTCAFCWGHQFHDERTTLAGALRRDVVPAEVRR